MEEKIVASNIILVAKKHNPAIATKEWLLEKKVFTKEPISFMNTEDFSAYDAGDLLLTVNPVQLVMQTKNAPSMQNIQQMGEHINLYTSNLTETPYFAIGLNLHWKIEKTKEEDDLSNTLKKNICCNISKVEEMLDTKSFRFGAKFIYPFENTMLTIELMPVDVSGQFTMAMFNFEMNVKKTVKANSISLIQIFTANLLAYYEKSKIILDLLICK